MDKLDHDILKALNGKSLTTPEIARVLKINGGKARSYCKRLEENGFVTSAMGETHCLFCADDKEVVTKENHATHEGHDLRMFPGKVLNWTIKKAGRKALESA